MKLSLINLVCIICLLLTPADRIAFEHCRTRDRVPFTDPACSSLDLDSDGDVDLSDFGVMQARPNIRSVELLFVIRVDGYEPLLRINSRQVIELLNRQLSSQPAR